MEERDVERILAQDLARGTEAFRDALLKRCLAVLGSKNDTPLAPVQTNALGDVEGRRDALGDDELELLAAAGDLARDPEGR